MAGRKPPRILLASAWQNQVFTLALARCARQAGWHLDLQMYLSGELPSEWLGEGIIALLGEDRRDVSRLVKQAKCPVVCVSANEPQTVVPRVVFDSRAVGRLAAQHLLEKGFTSFAWYSHRWQHVEQLRCDSFAETVDTAGHPCAKLIWELEQGKRKNTWANRQAWLVRKLDRLPRPLAVFAVDDTVAVEVIEAFGRLGLQIPGEVAVLGTGNLDVFRESTPVTLSSVKVDFDRLACEAATLLDRLMAGEPAPKDPIILPPNGIAARRSTDTLAVEHPQVARAIRFMFDYFAAPIGVREIVASTTVSQTRLYIAFQEQLGKSPVAVLNRIRLGKATQMLRDTDQPIKEVAIACGFGESINLYRSFQREFQTSPQAYRREFPCGSWAPPDP